MKKIVKVLTEKNKTISAMESCTGGAVANAITNVEGASEVLKFSAVTYSNEYKIKMGVSNKIINKYSVYSMETANEMSKNISEFTNSNYGIGITGKLNRLDKRNPFGEDNIVYISIYDKDNKKYYNSEIKVFKETRQQNKKVVIKEIIKILQEVTNTVEGPKPTGFLIGVRINDDNEYNLVKIDISNIVSEKTNNTKNEKM